MHITLWTKPQCDTTSNFIGFCVRVKSVSSKQCNTNYDLSVDKVGLWNCFDALILVGPQRNSYTALVIILKNIVLYIGAYQGVIGCPN